MREQIRRVGALVSAGRVTEAKATAEEILPLLDGDERARLLVTLDCVHAYQGLLPAPARTARTDDPAVRAGQLISRGLRCAYRGLFDQATGALHAAEALARRTGLRDVEVMARNNLGFVAAQRGDTALALALFREIEPELTGDRLAQSRIDRAETLLAAGLPGEARDLLTETLATAKAAGHAAEAANALYTLALAELDCGDARRATGTAHRAKLLFAAQDRAGWVVKADHALVRARTAAGERTPALLSAARTTATRLDHIGWRDAATETWCAAATAFPTQAPDLLRPQPHPSLRLRLATQRTAARVHTATGDHRRALTATRAALRTAADLAATTSSLELRAALAAQCADLIPPPPTLPARTLLDLAELHRRIAWPGRPTPPPLHKPNTGTDPNTGTRPDAGPTPNASTQPNAATALNAETRPGVGTWSGAGTGPGSGAGGRVRGGGEFVDEVARERWLRERGRVGGMGVRGPEVGFGDLVAVLGETVLVEFVCGGDVLVAVTVRDGRCRRWELGSYREMVRELRFARLAATQALAARRAEAAAFEVLRGRFREVLEEIGGREGVVAPTGDLYGVPWGAIIPGAFSVVPSAAAWVDAVAGAPRGEGVVLIAGTDAPHAVVEIGAVAAVYGRAASHDLRAIPGARVVHFAGHGTYRSDDPLLSGLVTGRGLVTGYELAGLGGVPELVVLSACDAGQGRDALGIPGQLLALGVRTVVASVLPVDDERAVAFMTGLHRGLADGLRPAEALARVERHGGTAGFQCFGAG